MNTSSGPERHFSMRASISTDLPPQSWLAKVCENEVQVLCGKNVEVFSHGLVEGCWDGRFEDYRFTEAENFFGTGVMIENNAVVFSTPTHTLEALYLLQGKGRLIVSNSLVFLLEYSGLSLPVSKNYGKRFATMVLGINKYEKMLCDIDGNKLFRVAYTNAIWNERSLTFSKKREPGQFSGFAQYHSYLLETLKKTFDNGASQYRHQVWEPITSCSSGYDSTACAALAASLGCNESLTLKSGQGRKEDSGNQVASALNIQVHEYDRNEMVDIQGFPEAEFFATGMGGEDYVYRVFENRLSHRIFLTGFHGDKIWDLHAVPNAEIMRGDISGSSMTEWRLRASFVLVPVPFIGVTRHHDINRISHSDELADFRVNDRAYDRPVPRKIAEDMYVPRAAFGQSKKAASMLFCHSLRYMSPASMQDLEEFRKENFQGITLYYQHLRQGLYNARLATMKKSLVWLGKVFNTNYPVLWRLQAVWQRHENMLKKTLMDVIVGDYRVFEHSSPLKSDLPFLWSINKLKGRYRIGTK